LQSAAKLQKTENHRQVKMENTSPAPEADSLRGILIRNHLPKEFDGLCMQIFNFQYHHNYLYRNFCDLLHKNPQNCIFPDQIPFLPVEFFRTHQVLSTAGVPTPVLSFHSSGTLSTIPSVHFIADPTLYEESFLKGFELVFGSPSGYHLFALLPSYLERSDSSLVFMTNRLMMETGSRQGGFFLNEYADLEKALSDALQTDRKVLLMGVGYALLDFAASLKKKLPELMVVETGGMKGRRKEMVKEELYDILQEAMGVDEILSEYGMTELCSQAWSSGKGVFRCPPWMKIVIRDIHDPYYSLPAEKTGLICIIDFANLYSCSFLATQDLGKIDINGNFEVMGRADNSMIRGCNLMVD
jgi:hypothetical protein